ncbi:MAG: SDR family oxidoreductase [Bacilli bacterium]|nr:SDR family oxidoreductase [Bacilli bacterium]
MKETNYTNKNVIITGVANGVGKAVAEELKNENLILLDIDEINLKELATNINCEYFVCDVSDDQQILNVISEINSRYERIDCLINCAKMWIFGDMSKTGSNAFRKAIQNDLAQNNIKITDVCPGLIQTDFYKRANNELPNNIMETGLSPKDVASTVKFVLDLPHEITIPSIEVRNIKNY